MYSIKSGNDFIWFLTMFGITNQEAAVIAGVKDETIERYCGKGKGYENGPPNLAIRKICAHIASQ